jgi:hypothetical protein
LGEVLRLIGERTDGTEALEQSVAAYRAALQVRTQEATPVDWAWTTDDLAWALKTLGQRTGNRAMVAEARQLMQASWDTYTAQGYDHTEYFTPRLAEVDATLASLPPPPPAGPPAPPSGG